MCFQYENIWGYIDNVSPSIHPFCSAYLRLDHRGNRSRRETQTSVFQLCSSSWRIYTHRPLSQVQLLVKGWSPFCLQNGLNSSWHTFNKVLETFLRDFAPYWHDSITQLLQMCRLHIYDGNLPFYPKAALLDWDLVTVEAVGVQGTHCDVQEASLRWYELCDVVHYPAGSSHQKMGHCAHKGMEMVSSNTQAGCSM